MSRLIMGYWDCPYCGTRGNRGDVVNCPSCGRARGEVQFYVKNYEEGQSLTEDQLNQYEQVDEEKAKYISKNPDWYCSFCNSLNSDNARNCGNCGASRADSESNYFQMLQKKKDREAAEAAAQPQVQEPKKRTRPPWLVIACVVLAVIGLVVWLNGKTSGDWKVTGLYWERSVQVEQNRMFSESDWTLPAGAEQTAARNELHHYDSVLDHYETVEVQRSRQVFDHYEYTLVDNGNGTFSEQSHPVYRTEYYTDTEQKPVYRQVPRYQTKYYYNIWRWVASRVATASGDSHDAAWPDLNLAEDERDSGRNEQKYIFTVENLKKPGETRSFQVDENVWDGINTGDTLTITDTNTGSHYMEDGSGNKIQLKPFR